MSKSLISRREFLTSGFALAAAAPLLGSAPQHGKLFSIENVKISLPSLADEFENFKIGYISDIHLSAFLQSDLLEQVVACLKLEALDLLLLGGDYIWRPRDFYRDLFPVYRREFADLDHPQLSAHIYTSFVSAISEVSAREGIYAVLGNHDHWAAALVCEQAFRNTPVHLLLNKCAEIKRNHKILEIVGTDDFLTGQPRFPQVNQLANTRILLTHNPDILPWFLNADTVRFDLALMGHTHGGQICATPGLPLLLNIRNTEYGVGLAKHPSGCQCYTTRGIGCVGLPVRINCPPEVTIVTLSKGSSE